MIFPSLKSSFIPISYILWNRGSRKEGSSYGYLTTQWPFRPLNADNIFPIEKGQQLFIYDSVRWDKKRLNCIFSKGDSTVSLVFFTIILQRAWIVAVFLQLFQLLLDKRKRQHRVSPFFTVSWHQSESLLLKWKKPLLNIHFRSFGISPRLNLLCRYLYVLNNHSDLYQKLSLNLLGIF